MSADGKVWLFLTPNASRKFGSSVAAKPLKRNAKYMKKEKTSKSQNKEADEMLPEYDFRGGVRGKHYKAYRRGHTVTIHNSDGTTQVQHFKLEEGAVMLEPDVREYFTDSETVNNALRGLITLLPRKPKVRART
jgi:hypothetical protein